MKRILSLALAILIVGSSVALAACGNKDKDKNNDIDNPGTETPDVPETPEDPEDPVDPEIPADPEEPEDPAVGEDGFLNVNESVKATVTVEIRLSPELDIDNVIGSLRVNQVVNRTGISPDGTWSRILMTPAGFEEGTYYVASNCLELYDNTLPEDPETPVNPDVNVPDTNEPETVYVWLEYDYRLSTLALRKQPDLKSEVVDKVGVGTALKRLAVEGSWSLVEYNGIQCYAYTHYLTTENLSGSDFITLDTPETRTVTALSLWVRYCPLSKTGNGTNQTDTVVIDSVTRTGISLAAGATVTVVAYSADGSWVRIEWPDGNQYYVGAAFLSGYTGPIPSTPTTPETPDTPNTPVTPETPALQFIPLTPPQTMYPNSSNVRVFTQPDDTSAVHDTLSMSDMVLVIATSENGGHWSKVNLAGDTTPYYIQAVNLSSSGKS